jgi:hypothetical protein
MTTCFAHKNAVKETMKAVREHTIEHDRPDPMEEGCNEPKAPLQPDGEMFRHTANVLVLALFQRVGTISNVRLTEAAKKAEALGFHMEIKGFSAF